jgi:heme-degrading monooxygenase HmoA
MQLASLNVGRLLAPLDSPQIAEFVAQLEPINRLADGSPGFVWRLMTAEGDATALRPFEDDLMLVNLAVWESLESLRAFVYSSAHIEVLRQRREWFERLAAAHMVLWWVEPGHIPTVDEAIDRLERLRHDGPTPAAFTFRTPFASDAAGPGSPLVDAEFCWPDLAAS